MSISCAVERSFRDLLLKMPYEKITISMICKAAGVSRTAFYKCFSDKDDLVEKLIDKDIVQPILTLREMLPTKRIKSAPQLVTEQIYQGFIDNKEYYTRVNNIDNHRFLLKYLAGKLNALNNKIVEEYDLPEREKYYMAYFYAAANAILISKWIENGMDMAPSALSSYYNKWAGHYLTQASPFALDWS
ncbi:MAG: TetR/AcrR family transcriptional regulator [Coriobacteriales bacterium]|nr:TetR/AcrR family transcriptional regulator [Coriobacteriales bacterium]